MIEKVVMMNLEKGIDKFYFVMGALHVAGFPVKTHKTGVSWDEFFVRSVPHDVDLYANVNDVCTAAIDDGFDWFSSFSETPEKYTKYPIAWAWMWGTTLRKIAELNQTVMLLIDDVTPAYMWTYDLYRRLAKESAKRRDFKALQLRAQADRGSQCLPAVKYLGKLIGRGFIGQVNHGFILNKAGAELLLEVQATPPIVDPGGDMMKIAEWGQTDQKFFNGLYHTLDHVVEVNYIGESNLNPPDISNHQ